VRREKKLFGMAYITEHNNAGEEGSQSAMLGVRIQADWQVFSVVELHNLVDKLGKADKIKRFKF